MQNIPQGCIQSWVPFDTFDTFELLDTFLTFCRSCYGISFKIYAASKIELFVTKNT